MSRSGRVGLAALAAVVGILFFVFSASAGGSNQTVSVDNNGVLTWTGGSNNNGNPNDDSVTFSQDGSTVTVHSNSSDQIDIVNDPNEDCSYAPAQTAYGTGVTDDTTTVVCTNVTQVIANAGAGDDTVDASGLSTIPSTLNGDDSDTTSDDTLTGGGAADTINGGAGDDTMYGNGGNDTMNGGDGSDTADGGDGNDTINGGAGDDYGDSVCGLRPNAVRSDGNCYPTGLDGGPGNDTIDGGPGDDWISGDGSNQEFGGDTTYNDTLTGGDGNDGIDAGPGDDTVDAGAGNDYVAGDDGNDTINGGDDTDYLDGGTGDDHVNGQGGDDANSYSGYANCDQALPVCDEYTDGGVFGGDGNDVVTGGDGTDYVEGDGGDSSYDDTSDNNNDTVQGDGGDDAYKINGSSGCCQNGYVEGGVYGNEGNDTVSGGDGRDYVDGGEGDDTVNGDAGDDSAHDWNSYTPNADLKAPPPPGVYGGGGNDTLNGGDGSDDLFPDEYCDPYPYCSSPQDPGKDVVNGNSGDDNIYDYADGHPDTLNGGDGVDDLTYTTYNTAGGAITATLNDQADDGAAPVGSDPGDPGNNFGSDIENVDIYTDCFSNCTYYDGTTQHGNGDATIVGTAAANVLQGDYGNDDITGGDGADYLAGWGGNDTIHARDGYPDYVDCGDGVDTAIVDQFDTVHNCENVDEADVKSAFDKSQPPTPPTPPPGAPGSSKDTTPPGVNLTVPNGGSITGNQLVLGFRVTAQCNEDCALSLRLLAQQEPGTATFARVKGYNVVVGRRTVGFGKSKKNIRVRPCERKQGGPQSKACLKRFVKALNARIRKVGKVTMKLLVVTVDRAGNRSKKTKTIVIRHQVH